MSFPNFFVGTWAQPVESIPKWKAEGVNLMIGMSQSGNNTAAQRRAACGQAGLYYIDMPADVADTLSMVNDPFCYGVMYPDEGESNFPFYSADPKGFQAAVAAWDAKWDPILLPAKGKKVVWQNYAGGNITGGRPWNNGTQQKACAKQTDEVCGDWYPITTDFDRYWDHWNDGTNLPVSLTSNNAKDPMSISTTLPQYMVRCLKTYFPGKPVWAYTETCMFQNSNVKGRQVTAADFNKTVASLMAEGVKGIVYFTHYFQGPGWIPNGGPGQTDWDGRPADVAAACKAWALPLTSTVVAPPVDLITPRVTALESKETALEARVSALEAKLAKVKSDL